MNVKEMIRSFSSERWAIGFVRNSINSLLNGDKVIVDWVQDTIRSRWFADPFILEADENQIIVLAEEISKSYMQGKVGRISRLTIDRHSLRILDVAPILELDTHLSFPVIYRMGGMVYICPENSASGHLSLYRYNDDKRLCTPVCVLCRDPLTDAVLTNCFGEPLIFATMPPKANGSELRIYAKENNENVFKFRELHLLSENVARMAGCFFEYNNCIYRPSQECNVQYGHAISIQKVTYNKGIWQFSEVRRIYSTHPSLTEGTHTFNIYKDLIVTDALGFDRMWIRKCLRKLRMLP